MARVPGAASPEAMLFDPAAARGLFVGISVFPDQSFPPIPYAVDDAIDLAALFCLELNLLNPQGTVLALAGEAVKPESRQRQEQLLAAGATTLAPRMPDLLKEVQRQARQVAKQGLLVTSLATHGLSLNGRSLLVAENSDFSLIWDTALELSSFFEVISRANCSRRLVLLDACRSRFAPGSRGSEGKGLSSEALRQAIVQSKGLAVLWGAVLGGSTYDDPQTRNGVFSGAVISGLRGNATADARGFITTGTLASFVDSAVQGWVEINRPDKNDGLEGSAAEFSPSEACEWPLAEHAIAKQQHQNARIASCRKKLKRMVGTALKGSDFDGLVGVLDQEPVSVIHSLLEAIESSPLSRADEILEAWRSLVAAKNPAPIAVMAEANPPRTKALQRWVWAGGMALCGCLVAGIGWLNRPAITPLEKNALEKVTVNNLSGQPPLIENPPPVAVSKPTAPDFGGTTGLERVASSAILTTTTSPSAASHLIGQNPQTVGVAGELATDAFGIRFRFVPPGRVQLAGPEVEVARRQWVKTPGLWVMETEVSQQLWQQAGLINRSHFDRCPSCPVENVNFFEAVAFANRLSSLVGREPCYETVCTGAVGTKNFTCDQVELKSKLCKGYRLLSDAEWEQAAGLEPEGPDRNSLDLLAWYAANAQGNTHPVGTRATNRYGLMDFLGNVREWTFDTDALLPDPNLGSPAVPAAQAQRGSRRIARGGSYGTVGGKKLWQERSTYPPTWRQAYLGLRLATPQKPEALRTPDLRASFRNGG